MFLSIARAAFLHFTFRAQAYAFIFGTRWHPHRGELAVLRCPIHGPRSGTDMVTSRRRRPVRPPTGPAMRRVAHDRHLPHREPELKRRPVQSPATASPRRRGSPDQFPETTR